MMVLRILILGGTIEARELSERLAGDDRLSVTVSLAGRTRNPVPHPVPVRTGGFGGAEGLARHLEDRAIGLLVDATHPFAGRMSENAAIAAARTGIHAFALVRPPWTAGPGDRWSGYPDSRSAVLALGVRKRRVFVALGRQDLDALLLAPQHRYLVRSVDPVEPALPLPDAGFLEARGPFPEDEEFELLRSNGIEAIIAKNSGGRASAAKLAAARRLAIPVHLIERPAARGLPGVETVAEAVERISHLLASAARRGA